MRASVVCGHSTYEERARLVGRWLSSKGVNVDLLVSDWDHIGKRRRQDINSDSVAVPTLGYTKNISLARVLSNILFSARAMATTSEAQPDIIYVMLPPNSLAWAAAAYRRRRPDVRLVFDILDLWPEAFPSKFVEKTPIAPIWRNLRNSSLSAADLILTECDMFRESVSSHRGRAKLLSLYYSKQDVIPYQERTPDSESLRLCYLGSINNVIDIDAISRVVGLLPGEVTVEIIGDGESRDRLISAIESAGATVNFHGKVFDPYHKARIMGNCHFGINMMKSSVRVGLSMKSIEYLQHGLPILNTLQGDTKALIEETGVGINVSNLDRPLSPTLVWESANNRSLARRVYEQRFSEDVFYRTLDLGFDGIGVNGEEDPFSRASFEPHEW